MWSVNSLLMRVDDYFRKWCSSTSRPLRMITGMNAFSSLLRFYHFYLLNLAAEWKAHPKTFILSSYRITVLLLLLFLFPCFIIWNHLGFALDDIFYPKWRQQAIDNPIFIIGNARSGTTWLHRLLSQDASAFTSMKSWEILFAPSITWRRLFHLLFHIDYYWMYGAVWKGLSALEHRYLSHIKIHPIGLMQPEEDEWIMMHVFSCQLVLFFFPLGGAFLNELILFDMHPSNQEETLSLEMKRSIFSYYRECIQRHLYYHTNHHHHDCNRVLFISKNPPFTLRLETLTNIFPDCRILCMVRDPVESIPSMVSYISQVPVTYEYLQFRSSPPLFVIELLCCVVLYVLNDCL